MKFFEGWDSSEKLTLMVVVTVAGSIVVLFSGLQFMESAEASWALANGYEQRVVQQPGRDRVDVIWVKAKPESNP